MWNGEFGHVVEKAIRAVVRYGELMGAEKLVRVSHAHVSGVSIFNIGDAGLSFIEDVASGNVRFRVFTTANPYAAVSLSFNGRLFSNEVITKQHRVIESLRRLGSVAFTCAPYYVRRPRAGEHLAWAESNAVLYANSVAGAMTNREGGPIALLEALIGRAPYYGMHIRGERMPDYVIKVPRPSSYVESAVIGYLIGMLNPSKTPLVKGLPRHVPEHWVRAMLAGFGASSHQPIMFLDGISPDLRLSGGLGKSAQLERLSLDESDVREFIRDRSCLEADLLVIGCPHLSNEEVLEAFMNVASAVNGGKIRVRECWMVTGDFIDEEILKQAQQVMTAYDVRVKVLRDVCPVVTKLSELGINSICTDSAKALHYMPKLAGVDACILAGIR